MTKKEDGPEGAVESKQVKLTAFLSGADGASSSPGSIVTLDIAEADRLVALGAAVEIKAEAEAEAE